MSELYHGTIFRKIIGILFLIKQNKLFIIEIEPLFLLQFFYVKVNKPT